MLTELDRGRTVEYGLEGLALAASRLVGRLPGAAADGRVSDLPDPRTIRYYQTLGVVDKPLRYDGRRAVYGYRHLLQVAAVKLLQANGLSLDQVQRALHGASTEALEAALADAGPVAGAGRSELQGPPQSRSVEMPAWLPDRTTFRRRRAGPGGRWRGVEVAPGIIVLIDPDLHSDPEGLIDLMKSCIQPDAGEKP